MAGLNNQIVTGVFWNSVQLIVNRAFSFIIKLVLARLLFPEDFGIVGMAAVFTSFVTVFNDLGIGAALVQKKEEDLNEKHFHTAFWTGVVWSVLVYLVVAFAVAPLAAQFYSQPIIADIIPVLSLGILSSPINLVHKAQLTKELNFKKIAFISNVSNIFSGLLSLGLAFYGAGVWALVFNSVASLIIGIPLYFKATKWKPRLKWGKKEFKEVFGFGIYTTGTKVFNNLISKMDYLVIGKMLSASALGVYTLAFLLTDTFRSQLMAVMNNVMYPVYGRLQDNLHSLKSYYLKVVLYNSLLVFPIMVFFFVLGQPFVNLFFGDKWNGSIEPLRILSIAVMFHMMANSNTSLIRGLGKPRLEMKIQIFKATLFYVPLILLGTYYFGIIGAAYSVLIHKVISVIIAQYFLSKLVNISLIDLFNAVKTPVIGSLVSGSISWLLFSYTSLHFVAIGIILFLSYALVVYFLMKTELLELFYKLRINFYDKKSQKDPVKS